MNSLRYTLWILLAFFAIACANDSPSLARNSTQLSPPSDVTNGLTPMHWDIMDGKAYCFSQRDAQHIVEWMDVVEILQTPPLERITWLKTEDSWAWVYSIQSDPCDPLSLPLWQTRIEPVDLEINGEFRINLPVWMQERFSDIGDCPDSNPTKLEIRGKLESDFSIMAIDDWRYWMNRASFTMWANASRPIFPCPIPACRSTRDPNSVFESLR